MIAKKLTLLTATAALLEPALAINHRHLHHGHQKRGEWITATIDGQVVSWENNYFGPGGAPPAAPTQPAAASQPEAAKAPAAPGPAPAQHTTIITKVTPKPTQAAPKPAPKPVVKEADAPAPKAVLKEKVQVKAKAESKPKSKPAESKPKPSGGSPGFSHKRGVCYNDIELANTFAGNCKNCGWGYNWDSESYGLDLPFIPTLWSDSPIHTERFPANVEKCLSAGAPAIFSFNEPDNGGQANQKPEDSAVSHVKLLNKYAGKALIGSPSISNSGLPGEGTQWLESWVSACEKLDEKCHYDFCNVHWYSEVQYGETLFEHLEKSHEICGGKPIWLTEFAPKGSDEAIASWLEEAIPRLEALEYLDAYSYFKVEQGMLMTDKTSLSTYGSVYASA